MCFLPLKSSHYPSRPVPVPELFGKYPTRPIPKSKTPTRRTLPVIQVFFADTDGLQGSEASKLAGEFQGRDQAG